MRLEHLQIGGFGCLEGTAVDFAPGLTVVLGTNEAGKSTVLWAIRAALYGLDAGGQGRPVAGSPWARWRPWTGRRYDLTLVYQLRDGRRFRVARRFDEREQPTQVLELGGRDVTDEMRRGRSVVPAAVHLGIDEPVFSATAWLGEAGLDPQDADTPWGRADHLRETIERLADSASRATAAEALERLRRAMDRVGTEQRSKTPLGRASLRLAEVERQLAQARSIADRLAAEQDRLLALDQEAAEAEERRDRAEVAWLLARLADIRWRARELAATREELERVQALVDQWQRYASFPADQLERVVAIGTDLRRARREEEAAVTLWHEAEARLGAVERRRQEVAAGVRALEGLAIDPAAVDRDALEQRRAELASAEAAAAEATRAVEQAMAGAAALRAEVANTGLGSVPVGQADVLADLLEAARAPRRSGRWLPRVAEAVAVLCLGAAAVEWRLGLRAGALGTLALVAAWLVAARLADRLVGGSAAEARRRLSQRFRGIDTSDAGLERAAANLDALRRLHAELQRREALVVATRDQAALAARRLDEVATRCVEWAAALGVRSAVRSGDVPPGPVPGGPTATAAASTVVAEARAALEALDRALAAGHRRAELHAEAEALAAEAAECRRLEEAAARAQETRRLLEKQLERVLAAAGLEPVADPDQAIAAFRQGATIRHQLEQNSVRLAQLRQRLATFGPGAGEALAHAEEAVLADLARRGAASLAGQTDQPPPPGELARLEAEKERARQAASAARARADDLRARLRGALEPVDGRPSIADLEDERAACLAVREHCLHQLAALRRASEVIAEAAREVHRNVAPRLADSLRRRLDLLTEGRYTDVNVDADHFEVTLAARDRPELVPMGLVSRGTRDQVSLLLRLALVEVLSDAGEPVPVLLDDPLATSDPRRRRTALDFLLRLSSATQVVLATTDPATAEMVQGVADCAVVRLAVPPGRTTPRLHVLGAYSPQAWDTT